MLANFFSRLKSIVSERNDSINNQACISTNSNIYLYAESSNVWANLPMNPYHDMDSDKLNAGIS